MYQKIKIPVCIILLCLGGCQNNGGSSNSADRLTSVKWTFLGIRFTETNETKLLPVDLEGMNVVFNKSNSFHAVSCCNMFDGNFIRSGSNSLKINNLSTTKMFCPEVVIVSWESIYFEGFKFSDSIEIKGDTLKIFTGSKIVMLFKPEQQKTLPETGM